jgi:hypothetical protein
MPTFIVALIIITKLQNQARYPSMYEWIKKMWYIYTVECHSAISKNKSRLFAGKWIKLEISH